jgi:hypothetical protein
VGVKIVALGLFWGEEKKKGKTVSLSLIFSHLSHLSLENCAKKNEKVGSLGWH